VQLVLTHQSSGPETRVLELCVSHVIMEALMLPDEVVSTVAAAIVSLCVSPPSMR